MGPVEQAAVSALTQIIPEVEALNCKWVITGGFACYVYCVKRKLTDIDIDIDVGKDEPRFVSMLEKFNASITQLVDNNSLMR